jgi:hypothetical protein
VNFEKGALADLALPTDILGLCSWEIVDIGIRPTTHNRAGLIQAPAITKNYLLIREVARIPHNCLVKYKGY